MNGTRKVRKYWLSENMRSKIGAVCSTDLTATNRCHCLIKLASNFK